MFLQKFGFRLLILGVVMSAGPCLLRAQEANSSNTLRLVPGRPSPPASLEAASWLAGYWEGEGLGGRIEEAWSSPARDSMMGMFRLLRADETVFSEILQLIEIDGSLELRVRHFNPDFTAWEDRETFVRFPLVKTEPDRLYFSGLTLKKESPDQLTIFIVLQRGGERSEEKLTLRRVDLRP